MTNQQPPDIIEIGGVKYQRIVEEPKRQTLYDIIYNWRYDVYDQTCEKLVESIEEWLSQYNCDYVCSAEYLQGYDALMEILKANLK